VQDGQGKGLFMKAIDDLAHQIRAFVAVEQAREGLDLKVSAGFDRTRMRVGGFVQPRFVWSPEDKAAAVPGEVGFQVARARLEQQSTLSRAAAGEGGICSMARQPPGGTGDVGSSGSGSGPT
jgi:hypothetical protein